MLAHLVGGGRAGRPASPPADDGQLSLDLAAAPSPEAWPEQPLRAPQPPAEVSAPPPPRRSTGGDSRRAAETMLARLRALGLPVGADAGGIDRCRLTRNRTVMVSFRAGELRVHRGYLGAPDEVLRAVVAFVRARTRTQRGAAQRVILAFPAHAEETAAVPATRPRRRERSDPADEPMVRVLADWHRRYNARHFDGTLRTVPIRVSRRLRRRLGHYTAAAPGGLPAEIVISRSHIRRHGWDEALHTLLHEMVHQWQDETGHAIDHGASFRRKAREVGIVPAARRALGRRDESAA